MAEKLDVERAAQVRVHLDACPHCGERYRKMSEDPDRRARHPRDQAIRVALLTR